MSTSEWTCERCGETFDARQVSALQHKCLVADESVEFDRAFTIYLSKPVGQFAMYYAQRLIQRAISSGAGRGASLRGNSDGSNNTLVV